jgi:GDSL-like Lipase/Acylhydrolase family
MRMAKAWKIAVYAVLLIICGEVGLQLLGFGHPALVTTDSPAQYEPVPDQCIHRVWPLSDSLIAHVCTNRFGMRSDPISENKPPGTLRIYFLGDSITWGTTQVDQRDLFTEIVPRELPLEVHQPVEVMNGSISGWAIANELAFLKEHGTLHADRVILVLNDGDPTQPIAPKPVDEDIPSIAHHPIFGYQELWDRGLRPDVSKLLQRMGIHWNQGGTEDPGLSVGHDQSVLESNIALLGQMNEFVKDSGAKLSILFIPFQDLLEAPTAGHESAGKEAIEHWAKTNCVPFVDLGPAMVQYPLDTVVLRDRRHFNTRGNRDIATQIETHWAQLVGVPCPHLQQEFVRH